MSDSGSRVDSSGGAPLRRHRRGERRWGAEPSVAFLGTYVPRRCGIATFTNDLATAIAGQLSKNSHWFVAASTPADDAPEYPDEVRFRLGQHDIRDYRRAAEYVNLSGVDVVCVQHEYGIYGGDAGSYVEEFLSLVRKPVVVTMHTVLEDPAEPYRRATEGLARLADALVVLSNRGATMLRDIYDVPESKIRMIHHGIPDVSFVDPSFYKDRFDVEGRTVLLTFGLLSRNKGIEYAIQALPKVVEEFPEIAYIVLGATHPEVKKTQGEEYRLYLQELVEDLGLKDHVTFHNRFVSLDTLCEFIGACDIYLTPYLSRAQVVSGTLAYALGMGKAVVSTPYWYAEEMLAEGRGVLVEFKDPEPISDAVLSLMREPAERHRMRKRAYELGREMVWRAVAGQYVQLFHDVCEAQARQAGTIALAERSFSIEAPDVNLNHLFRLTDDVSIMRHAPYGVPDRTEGYAVDDTSLALLAACKYHTQTKDAAVLGAISTYLAFLRHAQDEDGRFYDMMRYDRSFAPEFADEETYGKALCALGYVVARPPLAEMTGLAKDLFDRALAHLPRRHPIAVAHAIAGLHYYLLALSGASDVERALVELADGLVASYERESREDWPWFADSMTYANGKIPLALFLAFSSTGNERYREIAIESLGFLARTSFVEDVLEPVGTDGWYPRGGTKARFVQQPIEAACLVEAFAEAAKVTEDDDYLNGMREAFQWFLGRNTLGERLYNFTSGACSDALEPEGPSPNQGAEALSSFLVALCTMLRPR